MTFNEFVNKYKCNKQEIDLLYCYLIALKIVGIQNELGYLIYRNMR